MDTGEITRNIYIYGDIDIQRIEDTMSKLMAITDYDNRMDEQLKNYDREPIRVFICSGGGELMPTIGLCEAIRNSPTPVITICMGQASSAAFMILLSGHLRYAVQGSSLMAHQVAGGQFGSSRDCEIALQHMKRIEEYMINLFKEQSNMNEETINEIYHSQIDKYFSVEEAKELEIIDFIYGESIQVNDEGDEVDEDLDEDSENGCDDCPCTKEDE